jgi:hypothetical protein
MKASISQFKTFVSGKSGEKDLISQKQIPAKEIISQQQNPIENQVFLSSAEVSSPVRTINTPPLWFDWG